MGSPEPFPLLDFRRGIDRSRKAWIAPADAWAELVDCHLRDGRIEKRRGYKYLGQLGTKAVHSVGASGSTTYTGTLTNAPLLKKEASPSTYAVTFTDGTQVVTDNGAGVLTGAGTGTINYTTGAFSVTFGVVTTGAVTCAYQYLRQTISASGNAVMLVDNFTPLSGAEVFMALDRRRLFRWNATTRRFDDLEGADRWTQCTDETFYWAADYGNSRVFVNGVDTIFHYDAASGTIKEVSTDWVGAKNPADGGYTRRLETASLAFVFAGRMVFFKTREGGVDYPRRARWTKVDPNFDAFASFKANDWQDAPTNDRIVTAGFVNGQLVVAFESSWWRFGYTGDVVQPFQWIRLSDAYGAYARKGMIQLPQYAVAVGKNGMAASDGQRVERVAREIPDAVSGWNTSKLGYSYAVRVDELQQGWVTYAAENESHPAHVLAYEYDVEAFARYDLPFHSLGFWKQQDVILWNDADALYPTWDDADVTPDSLEQKSGFPVLVAGGRDQKVYYGSYGYNDNGNFYFLRAKTQRINPYAQLGRKARLHRIDVIAERNDEARLVLRLYSGLSDTPYRALQVPQLNGPSSDGQVKRQLRVNHVAQWHQVEVIDVAGSRVALDGLVLWFTPEGKARGIG
mgnify:CR=1 FL=1